MIALVSLLEVATVLLALLAAILWWVSAQVKTPDDFGVLGFPKIDKKGWSFMWNYDYVIKEGGLVGDTLIKNTFPQKISLLALALKKQSKLSSYAASCASLSAFCQFLLTLFTHFAPVIH